jgi:hypothetical protein
MFGLDNQIHSAHSSSLHGGRTCKPIRGQPITHGLSPSNNRPRDVFMVSAAEGKKGKDVSNLLKSSMVQNSQVHTTLAKAGYTTYRTRVRRIGQIISDASKNNRITRNKTEYSINRSWEPPKKVRKKVFDENRYAIPDEFIETDSLMDIYFEYKIAYHPNFWFTVQAVWDRDENRHYTPTSVVNFRQHPENYYHKVVTKQSKRDTLLNGPIDQERSPRRRAQVSAMVKRNPIQKRFNEITLAGYSKYKNCRATQKRFSWQEYGSAYCAREYQNEDWWSLISHAWVNQGHKVGKPHPKYAVYVFRSNGEEITPLTREMLGVG